MLAAPRADFSLVLYEGGVPSHEARAIIDTAAAAAAFTAKTARQTSAL